MTKLIAIDAGHGMNTAGKRTPKLTRDLVINGKVVRAKGSIIHEHEFNRAVAKYIAVGVKRCGMDYIYTADMVGNSDVALMSRSKKANNAKADILVSCHYNAMGSCEQFQTKIKGLLVLRTKNCSSDSIRLGNAIHNRLVKDCDYEYDYGLRRDVDMSGFTLAILRQTNMPAVLVEYGFMDYKKEAMKMLDPKWQKQCAEATVKGICDYFGMPYKKESSNTDDTPTIKYVAGQYRVKVDSLNIRKGPGTQYDKVGSITDKGTYNISKVSGNWGQLKSGIGWINISSTYCEKVTVKEEPEFKSYMIKIDTDILNVRKGPGTTYDKVTTVKKGDAYTIVEEAKDKDGNVWGLLKAFSKGRDGWISLKYTQKK